MNYVLIQWQSAANSFLLLLSAVIITNKKCIDVRRAVVNFEIFCKVMLREKGFRGFGVRFLGMVFPLLSSLVRFYNCASGVINHPLGWRAVGSLKWKSWREDGCFIYRRGRSEAIKVTLTIFCLPRMRRELEGYDSGNMNDWIMQLCIDNDASRNATLNLSSF